jgi:hypothetical protein
VTETTAAYASKHARGCVRRASGLVQTRHPEVILFSPGQFETCPPWVPGMDSGERFARIALKTIPVHRFDHRANWAAKVRNVSRLGSQS